MGIKIQKVIAALLLVGSTASADPTPGEVEIIHSMDPNEAVHKIIVSKVDSGDVSAVDLFDYPSDCSQMPVKDPGDDLMTSPTTIINTAYKIWKIIEENQPVVEVELKSAHALPKGIRCWNELENWQAPKAVTYRVVYKNLFGATVTEFKYRLLYTYGGQLKGQGRYLSNVSVRPAKLNVAWGYDFSANVEIPQVVNIGSTEEPVAGAEVTINWQVSTALKKSNNSISYFVDGLGSVRKYGE